jgi:molecular chaperone GrpE
MNVNYRYNTGANQYKRRYIGLNEQQTTSPDTGQVENTAEPEQTANIPPATPPEDTPDTSAGDKTTATIAGKLQAELETAQAEAEKMRDAWQRERAEFINYKKRVAQERVEAHASATIEVMKAVLPIVDDFERAVANIPEELRDTPFVEGTVAIERKLQRLLEKYDIETVDPVGEPFDPEAHQALGVDENAQVESGYVSETLQKGYRKDEKILRPALVRVAG